MMTNAKIVLIEDEKNICSLIERILAPQGCQVVSCFTGRDGLELIRSVRERRPEIVFVIVSGARKFEYAQRALRLRVYDYCLKPVQ